MSTSRRTPRRLAALATLALLAAPARAQEEQGRPIALVGATVHPIEGEAGPATVLLQGGRIRAVAPDLALPAEVRRIDLTGRHLYPGLIDADSVLGLVEIGSVGATVDYRELGRINPSLRAELAVNPDSELLPVARTGGVLLAHIAPRGGLIAGTSALITTDGWTFEDMTVQAPVLLHVRWPRMRVDPRREEPLEEQVRKREEALLAIDEAFADAAAYWKARTSSGVTPPDEDPKWEAMRKVIAREVPVGVSAERLSELRAALDWADRQQVRLILLGATDAWRIADDLALHEVAVVLGPSTHLPLRHHEAVDTVFAAAARLHEAGVRFAFSSGGSGWGAADSRNLKRQAALAVRHGLPPEAALRALTLGAAEILGVDARLGSIEAGKDATLIATDRPLLEEQARVTHAWIAGRQVSLEDRQLRLYEKYRARPPRR